MSLLAVTRPTRDVRGVFPTCIVFSSKKKSFSACTW